MNFQMSHVTQHHTHRVGHELLTLSQSYCEFRREENERESKKRVGNGTAFQMKESLMPNSPPMERIEAFYSCASISPDFQKVDFH